MYHIINFVVIILLMVFIYHIAMPVRYCWLADWQFMNVGFFLAAYAIGRFLKIGWDI